MTEIHNKFLNNGFIKCLLVQLLINIDLNIGVNILVLAE